MSPIHDQSYRRYQGTKLPLGRSWAVIAWAGIKTMLGRKVFLAVMLLGWIQFIVRAVQIWAVTMLPAASQVVPVDARMFLEFLEIQSIFVYFVTVYVGSGLIANDRRANALQIYLSKPLMRMEYIGGKLAILVLFLLEVTLLPALLLLVVEVLFSGSFAFLRANPTIIPAVVLSSLVRVFVSAFTILALSSLSKSGRYVAVLYTGAIFFTNALFLIMRLITGSTRIAWISITANIDQISQYMFRQPLRYETPILVSCIVLLALTVVSMSVLERRVRGVEVVK